MKKPSRQLPTRPVRFPLFRLLLTTGIVLVCLAFSASAQSTAPTAECRKAYTLIWQYRLAEADAIVKQQAAARPADPFPLYLASLSAFFKAFVTEDQAAFAAFKKSEETWLDKLADLDAKNPYTLFAQGEIHMHSGLIRFKMGERFYGAMSLSSAYDKLEACVKKFPAFLPAKKDLLFMQAAVGTVPESYRWMLNILGFSGNLNTSMKAYAELTKKLAAHTEYNLFTNEARIIHAYLNLYLLNKPDEAWTIMQAATADYANSELYAFVRANLAMRVKKTDLALEALAPHTTHLPAVPHLDYLYGSARLQHGDRDASVYLARFLKNYHGQNFIKDGYLRLAWAFLLRGDSKNYFNSLQLVRTYGTTHLEDDKAALREAQRTTLPPVALLRARLSYDGGYYTQASQSLAAVTEASFPQRIDQAEYHYRSGRVLEALAQPDKAIAEYSAVISRFSDLPVHFAPASALYIALIYEQRADATRAITWFRKCLSYKDYTYKDSFDQKANAGLRRLGK